MVSLWWWCCGCTFGPHNPVFHEDCMYCGRRRCSSCIQRPVSVSPRPSSSKSKVTPNAAARNKKKKQSEGNKKTEVKNIASSSKTPNTTKLSLEKFDARDQVQQAYTSPKAARDCPTAAVPSEVRSTSTTHSDHQKLDSAVSVIYSPTVGSTMTDWIYEQHSLSIYSSSDIQLLETILVELKSSQPENIFIDYEVKESLGNCFKGKIEVLLDGSLDWWPFQSYMPRLAQDQVTIRWECVCIPRSCLAQ